MRHRLEHAPELLDRPHHDRALLEQSLDHVAEVNRWLGGRRALIRAVHPLLHEDRVTRILDIGTGSADLPLALARHAARNGRSLDILATDVHPQMREIAAERTMAAPAIRIGAADALALPFAGNTFDIALLSLTLHHFDGDAQTTVVREAARVAARAVIINELERGHANLLGARLLAATRWRGNALTRHDGPLSVLRAFTRAELERLVRAAGCSVERLERNFFYRLVLTVDTRHA